MRDIESLLEVHGENLDDVIIAKLLYVNLKMMNRIGDTNTGKKLREKAREEFMKEIDLNSKESFDIQIRAGMSDEQLDTVRILLREKRSALRKLLCSSRTTGDVRRVEQSS